VGPIAFVIVFMVVPLAAAVFAGGFFAAIAVLRLLDAVPTGAWAAVTVTAAILVAARLWLVLRTLGKPGPGVGQGPRPGRRSGQSHR
jgi:hypothetical protein